MKRFQKKLTVLKNSDKNAPPAFKPVNYFDDLEIFAVTRKTFSGYPHRRLPIRPGDYSLEFIRSGQVVLHLDRMRILLSAPVLFWMGAPVKTFQFEYLESDASYEHLWVDFRGPRGARIYNALRSVSDKSSLDLPPETGRAVGGIFLDLLEKFRMDRSFHHNSLVLDIETILRHACDLFRTERPPSRNDPYRLHAAAALFRENPSAACDIAAMAENRGLSEMHFRILFKAEFGCPPGTFQFKLKMENAAAMLRAGRLRAGEIASECGFGGLSSFSRAFRRYYGLSPRAWLDKKLAEEKDAIAESF